MWNVADVGENYNKGNEYVADAHEGYHLLCDADDALAAAEQAEADKQGDDRADDNRSPGLIVEIVDPETLEPVPDGEIGELVLTTLCREAMPLLRYRTRDLTRVLGRSCPCGRNHVRLDRMRGRSDDMMVLRGVNIFPIQIEKILMQFKELGNNYLITLTTDEDNDNMTVEVELAEMFTDDYNRLQQLSKDITRALKDEILLTPRVKLVPRGTLPVSEGKAVRVVDKRKVYQ